MVIESEVAPSDPGAMETIVPKIGLEGSVTATDPPVASTIAPLVAGGGRREPLPLFLRTFGLGFGAAIGIVLFLAQSVSPGFQQAGVSVRGSRRAIDRASNPDALRDERTQLQGLPYRARGR